MINPYPNEKSAESASAPAPNFPHHAPPQGIPNQGEKFAGPLNKLAMSRFKGLKHKPKPKLKTKSKGIERDDKVHIRHRQIFY